MSSTRWSDLVVGALGLIALVSGCAYFNTFYNAQAHFDKAERIQESRPPGDETVAGSAVTEYDLTIEKCNKVIQRHAGSRWVDDAILLMGRAYFGKRVYPEALDKFRALVERYPDTNLRQEATFWAGVTYYRMGRIEEGKRTFQQLRAEGIPPSREAEILRVEAKAFMDADQIDEALVTYRRLIERHPGNRERVETLLELGELYMQAERFDSAYVAFDEVTRTADAFEVRLDARVLSGDALFRAGRIADGLETYRTALDVGRDLSREKRAPIELKIAECRSELGDHEAAIADYRVIAETYAGTVYAGEALFRIGFIQEMRYGEYETALATYDEMLALRGARSVFAEQAESRVARLRPLVSAGITTRDAQGGVDVDAEGAFLLAEQFLFQDADTLRSLQQYARVESLFAGSDVAARAAFARAWIHRARDAAPDSIVASFERILHVYPGTEQAVQAGEYLIAQGLADRIPEGAMDLIEPVPDASDPGDPTEGADGPAGATGSPVDDAARETAGARATVPGRSDSAGVVPRVPDPRDPDAIQAFLRARAARDSAGVQSTPVRVDD